MALLAGQALGDWPLYLCLPLAVVVIWLPRLRSRKVTGAVLAASDGEMSALTRDLSYSTSHNALSAAGVAYSVTRLADKLQSQLDAAVRIVGNAEVMIKTEQVTSQLSRQRSPCQQCRRAHGAGRVHQPHAPSEPARQRQP